MLRSSWPERTGGPPPMLKERRRMMRSVWKPGMRRALGTVALVLTLSVLVGPPRKVAAEETSSKPSIGQLVVPRLREFKLRESEAGPDHEASFVIYRVVKANGRLLFLAPDSGPGGWADASQVVPLQESLTWFNSAIQIAPGEPHNYVMRAMLVLVRRGDAEHALADCDQAVRLDPRYAPAYSIRGAVYDFQRDKNNALADLSMVIRLRPEDPLSYIARGNARLAWRQLGAAIADFNEAIRLNPNASAAYMSRALAWECERRIDQAIADCNHVIRLEPAKADGYMMRAAAYSLNKEPDKAISDANRALELNPKRTDTYWLRGSCWMAKNDYERAFADFSEAIKHQPNSPALYCGRAEASMRLGRSDDALWDVEQAIRMDPDKPDYYGLRADIWGYKKNFVRSAADYTRLLRRDPKNARAYALRGRAQVCRQRYGAAIADFNRALELAPDDPFILNNVAWFRATCSDAHSRDGTVAVSLAKRACELTGYKDADSLNTLAAACAETADFGSALRCQQKAIELESDAKKKAEYGERFALYEQKKPYREARA
jgi:tetratricopeptide (TPR) repeat protein